MSRALHWFRSDLRLRDNTALADVASRCDEIAFCFVFDESLMASTRTGSMRLQFLKDCVVRLRADLDRRGHRLIVRTGHVATEISTLVRDLRPDVLSINRGTTPYARARDEAVREAVEAAGVTWVEHKDAVIFEAPEVRTKSGGLFKVYTPYRRAWYRRIHEHELEGTRQLRLPRPASTRIAAGKVPTADPEAAGTGIPTGGEAAARRRLSQFAETQLARYPIDRDRPDVDGTSRLSPYLRFGAVSVRECIRVASIAAMQSPEKRAGAAKWIDELIWREFYAAQLEEAPQLRTRSFREEFDNIRWTNNPDMFDRWCRGQTGFPIIDAGMRQLAETGWMHNRVRMLTASFLTKDLLIDWRWGEEWFHRHLIDADPASNAGGWQWCASTGTDAQPYFRIFNPTRQGLRFDPEGTYVRRWIPELRSMPGAAAHDTVAIRKHATAYPAECVNHAAQRDITLAEYRRARSAKS